MDPRRFWALATLFFAAATMAVSVAQGAEPGIPYGEYRGSAVGGGGGFSAPFAITFYISPAGSGQAKVTAVTTRLPVPVEVVGTPAPAGGGWDIPLNVAMPSIQLSGHAVVALRPGGRDWVLRASGDGSFQGVSGSGLASGLSVSTPGVGQQVVDALTGFVAFGPPSEGTVAMPSRLSTAAAARWQGPAPAPVVASNVDPLGVGTAPPPGPVASVVGLSLLALLMIAGFFVGPEVP
jgi:hypothetical protein